MDSVILRPAAPEDAAALVKIYAPYVEKTAITFEYDVPTVEDFSGRIRATLQRYPYYVAEKDGRALGYAYAGAFHPRAAYDWCAEASIYLQEEAKGLGLGRRMYGLLEEALKEMGVTNLYACIAVPHEEEDEYLTFNSRDFHAHLGFETCGTFHRCGYKFHRWYDMVWMEKILGSHTAFQTPVKSYEQIKGEKT